MNIYFNFSFFSFFFCIAPIWLGIQRPQKFRKRSLLSPVSDSTYPYQYCTLPSLCKEIVGSLSLSNVCKTKLPLWHSQSKTQEHHQPFFLQNPVLLIKLNTELNIKSTVFISYIKAPTVLFYVGHYNERAVIIVSHAPSGPVYPPFCTIYIVYACFGQCN